MLTWDEVDRLEKLEKDIVDILKELKSISDRMYRMYILVSSYISDDRKKDIQKSIDSVAKYITHCNESTINLLNEIKIGV